MAFRYFGHARPALHVERDRFDYILLDHSRSQGTQVFEKVAVSQVDLDHGEQVRVTYCPTEERIPSGITCRFIVDASGQSAVVAKQLGIRVIDQGFRFMSIWGYFNNSKYVAIDGKAYTFDNLRNTPPTTFVSSLGDWGWVWHIPLRENTSVGLVLPLEQMKAVKATEEALEAYFLRRCSEVPYLDRLLEQAQYCAGSLHVIRDYSYRPTQLAGPGFFLVGDAAAFIDPIFSAGVVLAMYSGFSAAWAINRSLKNPKRVAEYQAQFANQLRGRLEVARSLALPRYGDGTASERAKEAIQFEKPSEQELMYVASTITTRNENFMEMVQDHEGHQVTSDKFWTIEEIVF
jgi:flavin-dependent dehydrogenase